MLDLQLARRVMNGGAAALASADLYHLVGDVSGENDQSGMVLR